MKIDDESVDRMCNTLNALAGMFPPQPIAPALAGMFPPQPIVPNPVIRQHILDAQEMISVIYEENKKLKEEKIMDRTINMTAILYGIRMRTDLNHAVTDVRVVIPSLGPNVYADWRYLDPYKDGDDTIVTFAGVTYYIWDDFRDYKGRRNNKEDAAEYLSKYQSWLYEKNDKKINGERHFGCTIYWKAMEVEK